MDRSPEIQCSDHGINAGYKSLRSDIGELERFRLGIGAGKCIGPSGNIRIDTIFVGSPLWDTGASGGIDNEGKIMGVGRGNNFTGGGAAWLPTRFLR